MLTGSGTGRALPGPTQGWIERFNAQGLSDEERYSLLVERFASVGEDALIRPPFFCDLGYNISLGPGAFLNFNCIILDVEPVSIGEGTAIGPAVQILASDHPRDAQLRRQKVRFGRPVTIGANVWIGAGAIILPGVTIGDDAIVGAGSIVTRDVPAGVTVVGSPAREIETPAAPRKR
jgi:maltose O-acetyltransferase